MPAVSFQSRLEGVAHDASVAAPSKSMPPVWVAVLLVFGPPLGVFGVGHEVKPLPDMRGTDAARSKYRLPNGVTFSFQVSLNKVEPAHSNRCRNLFANND